MGPIRLIRVSIFSTLCQNATNAKRLLCHFGGEWEVFATGFAGSSVINDPINAKHRPCGLAQGTDGSLFVSDDVNGRIYRILYQ